MKEGGTIREKGTDDDELEKDREVSTRKVLLGRRDRRD